ncbi:MAG: hypothetical protein N3B21_19415 [Clostridia bacterium]|nr:hypothetical protein [Clostridia bacterium]
MKLSEILQLDLREPGNKDELRKALYKLPFFKDEAEGELFPEVEALESALWKMQKKYPVLLSYIMPGSVEEAYYSFMIKRTDTHEWIKTIYAQSMFEGFGKTTLFIFAYINNVLKKEG